MHLLFSKFYCDQISRFYVFTFSFLIFCCSFSLQLHSEFMCQFRFINLMLKRIYFFIVSFMTVVFNQGKVLHARDIWQCFETLLVLTKIWGRNATGIKWLEDWDASKPPAMHRTVSFIKELFKSNGNSAHRETFSM